MKPKVWMCLALAGYLGLAGCVNTKSKDGKNIAAATSLGDIFADDLYADLTDAYNSKEYPYAFVKQQILDKNFPVTKDMEVHADQYIENVKSYVANYYGNSEETLISVLQNIAGVSSIEEFRKTTLANLQQSEMIKKYIKDNYDQVFDDYYKVATPRQIYLILVEAQDASKPTADEKKALKKVEDLLKKKTDFRKVALKYSDDEDTAQAHGYYGIVDAKDDSFSSTYGSEVYAQALALKQGQMSKAIKGEGGFVILYCGSTDQKKIKEELKVVDVSSPLLSYDSYIQYQAFQTYKIEYGDEDFKKAVEKTVKDNLNARKAERKASK